MELEVKSEAMANLNVNSMGNSTELLEVTEFGVSLYVNKDSLSPKKNEGYYCQEMDINRLSYQNI